MRVKLAFQWNLFSENYLRINLLTYLLTYLLNGLAPMLIILLLIIIIVYYFLIIMFRLIRTFYLFFHRSNRRKLCKYASIPFDIVLRLNPRKTTTKISLSKNIQYTNPVHLSAHAQCYSFISYGEQEREQKTFTYAFTKELRQRRAEILTKSMIDSRSYIRRSNSPLIC